MGKMSRLGNDLYNGHKSIDFIGRRWLWYGVTALLVGLAITALIVKPLNFGVEFRGGTEMKISVPGGTSQADADHLREAVADSGIPHDENPTVTTAGSDQLVLTTESLSGAAQDSTKALVADMFPGVNVNDDISVQDVGPSWGREVGQRALIGIGVFLILVVIFIWVYFREWKMSVGALIALFHDVALTMGVYALSGFQVTPAAVTGLLAILGFSLYDTVVVFDKIKENTTKLRKATQTYGDAANLAVNQTLVRSINTSIVALIPIGAILYVSAVQLGSSSLQDLALAQFVGMGAGVYSSVMLAPRVVVHLKSMETEVQAQARKAKARQKAMADRYASVPAFTEDMPVVDEPRSDRPGPGRVAVADEGDRGNVAQPADGALGRGRVVPTQQRPVSRSSSSGRQQPVRQSRSKRGKK
jgi:preprotein translocase subunit SecF